jgi:hypothetical protein
MSRRGDKTLAKIPERIGELDSRHTRVEAVFFSTDPLLPTASGPEHKQERRGHLRGEIKPSRCV